MPTSTHCQGAGDALTPAERETVQLVLLRRHLALVCPQGTRRRTDPQPAPASPRTLAGRRDLVRRLRQAGAERAAIAARVEASIGTVTRDLAWLRATGRLG